MCLGENSYISTFVFDVCDRKKKELTKESGEIIIYSWDEAFM